MGYVLLVLGLVIIGFATFSVLSVFGGNQQPTALFNFPGISLPTSSFVADSGQSGVEAPDIELISGAVLNSIVNTAAHLFLMGFIVTVGTKVASLGTYMLRPIVINTKEHADLKN